jgi:hypothetical protein
MRLKQLPAELVSRYTMTNLLITYFNYPDSMRSLRNLAIHEMARSAALIPPITD